jgi:HEAT repeat protein
MYAARIAKALAAVALFNGVLYLSLEPDAVAASNESDAKKFTQELKSGKDAKTKINALNELGRLGALQKPLVADALPLIYKALEDKDAGIRAAAAKCLGACDEPANKAVPALRKLLTADKEDSVKIAAAQGLMSMGNNAKAALPDLRKLAGGDKKSPVTKAAKNALKAIGK